MVTFSTSQVSVDDFKVSIVRLMGGVRLNREFGYCKMTEKRPGPAPGVSLIEVSVKRELTVPIFFLNDS